MQLKNIISINLDIDECLILAQPTKVPLVNTTLTLFCHEFADCINHAGYYGCQCRVGFTGNGTHCKGI